jgi:hypothetical protein
MAVAVPSVALECGSLLPLSSPESASKLAHSTDIRPLAGGGAIPSVALECGSLLPLSEPESASKLAHSTETRPLAGGGAIPSVFICVHRRFTLRLPWRSWRLGGFSPDSRIGEIGG